MIKTIKQYSKKLDPQVLLEIRSKARKTKSLMNWVYTQFNGNKSYYLIHTSRDTYIRDKVIGKETLKRFGLPTRSSGNTIRDAVGNLKSRWTDILKDVKDTVNRKVRDQSFNEHESHYLYTVITNIVLTHCILNEIHPNDFEYPNDQKRNFTLNLVALKYEDIDTNKLNNWFRRRVRKFKSVPKAKDSRQFPIEWSSRSTKTLKVQSKTPRKQISIDLSDSRKLYSTRLVIGSDNRIEVHNTSKVKVTKPKVTNVVGVDKGYRNMISTSSGNIYGKEFNDLISKQVDKQIRVGKQRNKLWAFKDKLIAKNKAKEVKNLELNNLGYKKLNSRAKKDNETTKNFINRNLNQFFKTEHPSEVIYEDLTKLEQKKDNGLSRKTRNKLNKWQKGYLQERLEFKASQYGSDLTAINPAYTSQICSLCGRLGSRQGDIFICSNESCKSEEQHADINAAKNILSRKYDSEVKLWMYPGSVKKILLDRIELSESSQLDQITDQSWTPKTLDTSVGDNIDNILLNIVSDYSVNQRANSGTTLGKNTRVSTKGRLPRFEIQEYV